MRSEWSYNAILEPETHRGIMIYSGWKPGWKSRIKTGSKIIPIDDKSSVLPSQCSVDHTGHVRWVYSILIYVCFPSIICPLRGWLKGILWLCYGYQCEVRVPSFGSIFCVFWILFSTFIIWHEPFLIKWAYAESCHIFQKLKKFYHVYLA